MGQFGRCRLYVRRAPSLAALVGLATICAASRASEPAAQFVAGLNQRGYYELTLDYLDQMANSPLADAEFRQRIPYHRGMTLIAEARQTPELERRTALFGQASQELEQFVQAHPDQPAAAEALLELANVLVDQAKQLLAQAGQIPDESTYAEQRDKLQKDARRLLAQAQPRFQQAEKFYATALDQMPKTLDPKTQGTLIAQRQEYRGREAQVSVLAGQAEFEAAATFASGSDEFIKHNDAAAKKLATLYEKYSHWLVGFYARLYEGRCYQAVGDYQRALGCYEELISQSSVHPAFRKLIATAYGYQAQCLVAQGKLDEAIANLNGWLGGAKEDEARTAEWLFARFELGEALRSKAESSETKPSERRGLISSARDAYRAVAAVPNDYQAAARAAATTLGPGDRPERPNLRDFVAAYQAGKDAMASVNAAKMALPSAAKNNPSAIAELRQQAAEGTQSAREDFQIALSLVDDDTKIDQLNEVRYFLCWLDWDAGDYYQSAVLGDFLARRYSDHPAAASAAKLALASYEQLQQSNLQKGSKPQDAEFESRKMAEIAEFMTRRWPGTPAAETAYRILVSYAIRSGRIDEAKGLIDQVSAAARPTLEAQLGNALWGRYLELSRQPAGQQPPAAEIDKLRDDALKYMQTGFDAARQTGRATEVSATAGLYLAQSLLDEEKYADAIALLEAPKVGPLTLVRDHSAAAARPEFAIEAYKAALRADVSATPPHISQAIEVMKELEAAVAAGSNAQGEQLMRIYLSLAKALDEQLVKLRDAGQSEDVARLSGALGKFLDHVSQQDTEASWGTRYWIAQTYYTLGESLHGGSSNSRQKAAPYFQKARAGFEQLATDAEKDPSLLPSPIARLAVANQLGECERELGNYKQALDAFSNVLADQESQLVVQQSAAQTYQKWGEADGGVKKLERAIYGGYQLRSTGKNRIWGWLKLALVAERGARTDAKYADIFFDARLQAARCRYLIGTKTEAGPERQRDFDLAKQSIRSMLQLYPELGGDTWRTKYEALLKQIQEAAGETPRGLAEFAANKQ
jgi:tetratricopeptide (TPR) repeat protein